MKYTAKLVKKEDHRAFSHLYNVTPDVGHIYVHFTHFGAPEGKPYFCCGRYYPTEQEAIEDFCRRCAMPDTPEGFRSSECEAAYLRVE